MARVFPDGAYESWTQCRSLLAYAKSVLNSMSDIEGENQLNTATLLSNCGLFLSGQGAYEETEAMHRQALGAQERVLGREHPDTLGSISDLGDALFKQGKYEEAKAMHRRAQTVEFSSLMRQGLLPRKMFSTPHPLLRLSKGHYGSGETHDRDVD